MAIAIERLVFISNQVFYRSVPFLSRSMTSGLNLSWERNADIKDESQALGKKGDVEKQGNVKDFLGMADQSWQFGFLGRP